MLLQTNSYIVPSEKRAAHASLLVRFRETLARLGCDVFEIYEQVGTNWDASQSTGRYVQIMRFRDREHQRSVQAAEGTDREAQLLIAEFCELINFPYQQEHGFFAVGFYTNIRSAAEEPDAITDADMTYAPDSDDLSLRLNDPSLDFAQPSAVPVTGHPEGELTTDSGGSGIGSVLEAGLMGDAFDVPMPAELFEDDEEPMVLPPKVRSKSTDPVKKVSSRR